jgi:hypothetical protein
MPLNIEYTTHEVFFLDRHRRVVRTKCDIYIFFIAKGDIFTIHSGLGDFELFIDKNVDI